MPFSQTFKPAVGFSGVPGAAQISDRFWKFIEQFQGAILKISSLRGSNRSLQLRASLESSVRAAICDRVPIEDRARFAMSISLVTLADSHHEDRQGQHRRHHEWQQDNGPSHD